MKARIINLLRFGIGAVIFAVLTTPALAFWQFVERPPGFERKISPRYNTEKECNDAFKIAEEKLKKAYPKRYPLIGSCEEYN